MPHREPQMKEQVCGDHERKIDNWDHEYMGVRKAVPGNIQHNNDIAHACSCRQDSPRLAVWAADTPADQHGDKQQQQHRSNGSATADCIKGFTA